jgi:hypothetical protein
MSLKLAWLAGLIVVSGFFSFLAVAVAHSFYPIECCSGYDCNMIDAKRVSFAPGGYMVDHKFFVPQKEVRKSEDGDYHACFPQPENLRCFFAPPQGS